MAFFVCRKPVQVRLPQIYSSALADKCVNFSNFDAIFMRFSRERTPEDKNMVIWVHTMKI